MSIIDNAGKILNNGYQVIPIATQGKQAPLVKGYLDAETEYTKKDAKEWSKKFDGAFIALVGGKNNVYALDFDIDDEVLAGQLLRVMKNNWAKLAIRKCNDPRFAVLFRAKGNLLSYSNAHSKAYKVDGEINQIELIGGRMITLYGKHRKTGAKYRWGHINPLKTHSDDLPELTLKDIQKIFKFYEKRVSEGSSMVLESSFRKPREKNTFETVRVQRVFSEHEVTDLLERATGDDRRSWIEVGMALHTHYQGSKDGLHIWDEWSSKFEGYEGLDDCRYNWKTFKSDGGITLSTIEKKTPRLITYEREDPEDVFERMLKNFVYVETPNMVVDLGDLVNEAALPLQIMRNSQANVFVERVGKDGRSNKDIVKQINVMDLWWKHPDRRKAYDEDYVPMNHRIIQPEHWGGRRRKTYYNSYVPPIVNLTPDTHLIQHFIDHVAYIFPSDPDWVMNWLAQIVQEPYKRHRVALYSICTNQGTGRGWLVEVINHLMGVSNVKTINSINDIIRPGAKTGYLHKSVMLIVNEVYAKGLERYDVTSKLKTLLSDNRQEIDLKWGKQEYSVEIFTRMFFQANGIGDLVIDESDKRMQTFINHSSPKSKQYYIDLYNLLETDHCAKFMDQVYTYLSNWDVNIELLQEAQTTEDKKVVIRANKNDTALAFYQFKLIVGDGLYTPKMLNGFLGDYNALNHPEDSGNLTSLINKKQLDAMQREQVLTSDFKRIKGKVAKIQSFRVYDIKALDDTKIIKSIVAGKRKLKQYFTNITDGHRK